LVQAAALHSTSRTARMMLTGLVHLDMRSNTLFSENIIYNGRLARSGHYKRKVFSPHAYDRRSIRTAIPETSSYLFIM